MAGGQAIAREVVDSVRFNPSFVYPYELRQLDFQVAMQDVYDFFFDVNTHLRSKDLERLDDMVELDDFRKNPRGELGTRTATLHADGIAELRQGWVYLAH